MASTREIQLRIKSVTGTQQITKAMKLVSTAKLQKIRGVAEAGKPYFNAVYETMSSILGRSGALAASPLLSDEERAGGKAAYLLITSNRGMAGGYNSNICRLLASEIADPEKALILTVGTRGRDYFARRGYNMGTHFEFEGELPTYSEVSRIAKEITALKEKGEVDALYVVYTSFVNTITQNPTIVKLLPFNPEDLEIKENPATMSLMNYEPGEEAVLAYIIPKYISGILNGALSESFASEEGARMTAMDSATDNAQDMIDSLTLKYNRARQGNITQELTEIVNGASALED